MPPLCRSLLACLLTTALSQASLSLKRVALVSSGNDGFGAVVCADADHDGQAEFSFERATPGQMMWRWETWEQQPVNRYELVKADTCIGNPYPPPGMHKGLLLPCDIGDVDDDGLIEVLGPNAEYFYTGSHWDSTRYYLCSYESADSNSYPDTLTWSYFYGTNNTVAPQPFVWLPGDLDRDGRKEIVFSDARYGQTHVFENRGNNQNELVYLTPAPYAGIDYAFGDFDRDGLREFVTFDATDHRYVWVYECAGDDSFALTWSQPRTFTGGYDIWSGNDLDRDGWPEFFINYWMYSSRLFYLCMYEATGNNTYVETLLDTVRHVLIPDNEQNSVCADLDLDGTEELIASYCRSGQRVYQATGNNQFQVVCSIVNPAPEYPGSYVATYDMNGNGYPDILVSGNARTYIYEVDAVKVISPNGGEVLSAGDTCIIKWQPITPPRCDSVSLFLRRDTTWQLDTIAPGLAPTDSTYPWIVPRPGGESEPGWIVAIAYGPGWQYDQSDGLFLMVPGIAEAPVGRIRTWSLAVLPSPASGRALVRYDVPERTFIQLGLYDATGRLVQELVSGERAPGSYEQSIGPGLAAGIHFIRLCAGGETRVLKLVLSR